MQIAKTLAATVFVAALAACGGGGNGAAQATADTITKAVIANDVGTVQNNLDDSLKPTITKASVGALSDAMQKLGTYEGLTLLSSDAAKNEYTYRADFTGGHMNVVIKLDSDGKAGAYKAIPA
ncbi:MAG TPA: hypothetical protein VIG46_00795 [Candidatus Baltobacteraceae bacterium]|jgi:hypothetical protein